MPSARRRSTADQPAAYLTGPKGFGLTPSGRTEPAFSPGPRSSPGHPVRVISPGEAAQRTGTEVTRNR